MSREKAKSSVDTEARKGRVYRYVATSKGLVPWAELQRAEIRKVEKETKAKSQQLKAEQDYMADKGLVPLPFNYAGLLTLMDNCSYFDACCRQIARDVTGQGWTIDLQEDATEDAAKQKAIKDFLSDPNTAEDAIDDIMERLIIDWGLIGMFCLEVVRDRGAALIDPNFRPGEGEAAVPVPVPAGEGLVNGLYHVPAQTIRAHKDGNKFCQIQGARYVWFRRFGYEKEVDANTGAEFETRDLGAVGGKVFIPANELIVYVNYYPQSAYYGAPQILPAVGAVKALIGIRDYNLSFFENYGVPAAIVTVEGEWDEEAVKQISDFIDVEIKGSNNAHKTIVVNPPEGGKIEWKPLVIEVKEGSFKLYFKQLRDEVLVCYRMPPYRIGIEETGALGGNVASEATRIYIDSTINPLKRILDHILTEKIIHDGLSCDTYEFSLNDLDIRDTQAITTRGVQLFGIGGISRNELRAELGMELIEAKKDPTADAYYISASYKEIGAEESAAGATAQAVAMEGAFKAMKDDIAEALKTAEKRRAQRPRGDMGAED